MPRNYANCKVFEGDVLKVDSFLNHQIDTELLKSKVYSFTHKCWNTIYVSAEYLSKGERVLIVDDFLASGSAIEGLVDLVSQADAEVAGIGICIEKSFQDGGMKIRTMGYKLESLAIIESMDNRTQEITFSEPN